MRNLKGKRILVVDDDEMLREILVDYLVDLEANVTTAENGTIAFKLVQEQKFDAVISDVRMPGGDGLTLMKNINDKISEKPKLFICSGFSDIKAEDQKKYNIISIFEKPFSKDHFLSVILESLAGKL